MFRALVFDLDDTLYVEREFVRSGYRAVARYLADAGSCEFETAFSVMVDTLEAQDRDRVFPTLLEKLPSVSVSIQELVDVYRRHIPSIELLPGYRELLRQLGRDYKLGIITDGLPDVQKRKIHALGLAEVMDRIIFTWEHGADKQKPHPLPFTLMLQALCVDPEEALFIGDNPEKDCRGAHGIGMKAAQVQNRAFAACRNSSPNPEIPEFMIETLYELPKILRQVN